jgi:S1-C subfamily serine protease
MGARRAAEEVPVKPASLGRISAVGALVLVSQAPLLWGARANEPRDAVVKIYATRLLPRNGAPWRPGSPSAVSGSGFVVDGQMIVTNAHIVRDATFVQVRRYGDSERATARVLHVSHEADLALLGVDEPGFFEPIAPLELGRLPELREEVVVVGFPVGGDTLSITRGVVSRIEHQTYVHSQVSLLAGQIDSAVNAGNSGGPVLAKGRVVGVAMQGNDAADNIAYMVPVPVVERFLADVADGHYDGVPRTGLRWQRLEATDLRRRYGLPPSGGGVLVLETAVGSAAARVLQAGDVLLSIGSHEIGADGTVEFRQRERTTFELLLQQRQVGDRVQVTLFRDGQIRQTELVLDRPLRGDKLVPGPTYGDPPSYFIFGGLAFCPLTTSYLRAWREWRSNAPKHLVTLLGRFPSFEGQRKVVLCGLMPASVNAGYQGLEESLIVEVDDRPVRNLRHLVEVVESKESGLLVLETHTGAQIVLDRERARREGPRILALYDVRADRSNDLAMVGRSIPARAVSAGSGP